MCAILTRDPFHLTLDEIARLDPIQVSKVLFYPRDKNGNLQLKRKQRRGLRGHIESPRGEDARVPQAALDMLAEVTSRPPPLEFLSMWWQVWRRRGFKDEDLLPRFREYLEKEARGGTH